MSIGSEVVGDFVFEVAWAEVWVCHYSNEIIVSCAYIVIYIETAG